jgi:hypothetical protein
VEEVEAGTPNPKWKMYKYICTKTRTAASKMQHTNVQGRL